MEVKRFEINKVSCMWRESDHYTTHLQIVLPEDEGGVREL
jgi:hypothetical protein